MRLEDAIFIDEERRPRLWLPTRVMGRVYGHPSFDDGSLVTTSRIIGRGFDEQGVPLSVQTPSGSHYEIGSLSAEYRQLEEAHKRGEPILIDWTLYEVRGSYRILGEDSFTAGVISGEIVSQDGNNFLTLITKGGEKKRVLVCWPHMSMKTRGQMGRGRVAGLTEADFEESFYRLCRPKLPVRHG